jgi:hypothetical protein
MAVDLMGLTPISPVTAEGGTVETPDFAGGSEVHRRLHRHRRRAQDHHGNGENQTRGKLFPSVRNRLNFICVSHKFYFLRISRFIQFLPVGEPGSEPLFKMPGCSTN